MTGTSRGNVTKVTMSVLPGASTISRGFKYDVFGNVVRADVSCCQTKTTAFSSATWFSQPDSVTEGDPMQTPHLTTSFSYDFSTGLALSTTDPNGQPTSFDYDSAWRVKTINSATGASTLTRFDKDSNQNDLLSYFQRVTYTEADGITTRTIASRSWFDGAGRVLRAGTAAGASPTSYDAVKTEYDAMGCAEGSGLTLLTFEHDTPASKDSATRAVLRDHSARVVMSINHHTSARLLSNGPHMSGSIVSVVPSAMPDQEPVPDREKY